MTDSTDACLKGPFVFLLWDARNVISVTFVGHELCCVVLRHFSHVQLFATPWSVAHQAPLSMGFSR